MNIKKTASSLLAALILISCNNDTLTLGTSIMPDEDLIGIESKSYFATSRSIHADTRLLARSSECYLGNYTDPDTETTTNAGFLTQLNCVENFEFPDSVYGLEQFHFPDSLKPAEGEKSFSANLKLFFTEYFGDARNSIKIEVWPIVNNLNPEEHYDAETDPAEFCDLSGTPLACINVSPTDFAANDSVRQLKDYYNNIYIPLPDSIAGNILKKYYSEGGKKMFSSAQEFINNVCKGFYIRCTQGDGTLICVDMTVLEIHFRYLKKDKVTKKFTLSPYIAEFTGNSEVMQTNIFRTEGIDKLINVDNNTFLKTPYGIITEVTIPIDEISANTTMVNSASMIFRRVNQANEKYSFGAPQTILLLRKDNLYSFFEKTSTIDNITSFFTTFNSVNNEYSFANISRMFIACISERSEWMKENGWSSDDPKGKEAYAEAFPNWNKVVLIPAVKQTDANNNILFFNIDNSPTGTKLKGGPAGDRIEIKAIKATFQYN